MGKTESLLRADDCVPATHLTSSLPHHIPKGLLPIGEVPSGGVPLRSRGGAKSSSRTKASSPQTSTQLMHQMAYRGKARPAIKAPFRDPLLKHSSRTPPATPPSSTRRTKAATPFVKSAEQLDREAMTRERVRVRSYKAMHVREMRAATKIQALTRGQLLRKREIELGPTGEASAAMPVGSFDSEELCGFDAEAAEIFDARISAALSQVLDAAAPHTPLPTRDAASPTSTAPPAVSPRHGSPIHIKDPLPDFKASSIDIERRRKVRTDHRVDKEKRREQNVAARKAAATERVRTRNQQIARVLEATAASRIEAAARKLLVRRTWHAAIEQARLRAQASSGHPVPAAASRWQIIKRHVLQAPS